MATTYIPGVRPSGRGPGEDARERVVETVERQVEDPAVAEAAAATVEVMAGGTGVLASVAGAVEGVDGDPRLGVYRKQYEELPASERSYNGRERTWEEVEAAILDVPSFLESVDTLFEPKVYFISAEGKLIVGDGCENAPNETRDNNYSTARYIATQIIYRNQDGKLRTLIGDVKALPKGSTILTERGLINEEEYERALKINRKFESNPEDTIWIESGKAPIKAQESSPAEGGKLFKAQEAYPAVSGRGITKHDCDPSIPKAHRGARSVVRAELALAA